MTEHPRYQHSLEELFLHVFIYVDDWLKANEARLELPKQRNQVASYSELFTIALVGEMLAQPYERIWYWLVKENHRDLFPRLPDYSRYHRVTRHAEGLWAELARSVLRESGLPKLIDSKLLPVAKQECRLMIRVRSTRSSAFRGDRKAGHEGISQSCV